MSSIGLYFKNSDTSDSCLLATSVWLFLKYSTNWHMLIDPGMN